MLNVLCSSFAKYNVCNLRSIGTNRTNRTNGRVEYTPTQPEADGNILSPRNEMHFTNGINDIPLVPIVPMDE